MNIGIRREDKGRWEGRVPLVPRDIRRLIGDHGIEFCVESSPIRVFADDRFREAGARVVDDLGDCPIILGVKEIPVQRFEPGKTYVYFAHVIKGQPANMPALRRLMELGCQLIDYEKITDDQGRRLVFFGEFAGRAGMIDTLWALGQRLQHEGVDSPFAQVRQAHQYDDLEHASALLTWTGTGSWRSTWPTTMGRCSAATAGTARISSAETCCDFPGAT